jgi:protein TonB
VTEIEPVHAPLAAPTYLTHITVPVFRRGRALSVAVAVHVVAVLVLVLMFHHRFRTIEPDEATVALVIEPSPYVGTGQTVITPVTKPTPRPVQTKPAPPKAEKATPAPSNASQSGPQAAVVAHAAMLPLPAPPAPPAPTPQQVAAPRPSPAPMPHLGNNQPAGYGLVVDTKIIPARPDARINMPPAYPPDALGRGEQGRVLLSIQVAPSGRASAVLVVSSSGYAILDDAARDAVLGWRFLPADLRGKPVWSTLLLPVRFQIDSSFASVR